MMTRKHFVRIAKILCENGVDEVTVEDFCNYFLQENPNFDILKFKEAAGVI